jgi:hypothetical protein
MLGWMNADMPTLIVRRDEGWTDRIRKYRILLDGEEIGRIGEGEELRQEIADGPHVIEAKIDWCGSPPLRFNATSEDKTVLVSSALLGWRAFVGIFYVIFNRRGYLDIRLLKQQSSRRRWEGKHES